MRRTTCVQNIVGLTLLLVLCGCQSPNGLTKKNKNEQLFIDQQVANAHCLFENGQYAAAEIILVPLAAEKTINQPLYQSELASVYLLSGKNEKAFQTLMAAHESIEGFFDQKSEKSATRLWGRESEKVFKGEPYERSTLYMMLALCFLEQGNADNALAALKTGMLADSDSEEKTFKEDYALLQFMAAKCYDLRNEPDLKNQMLDSCFDSLAENQTFTQSATTQLVAQYDRRAASDSLILPPSRNLASLCGLASEPKLISWLMANGQAEDRAKDIAIWVGQSTANTDPLKFNTLILLWTGQGPGMSRAGEYGEKRVIYPGVPYTETVCSLLVDQSDYDGIGGFGDLSFQATTRGGRVMDDVLSRQAAFKGGMDTGAGMMWEMSQQDYGNGAVNLGMIAAAGLFKATAAATKTEADVRHWTNLPCGFEMLALNLPSGTHDLCLRHWKYAIPLSDSESRFETKETALSVVHLQPSVADQSQLQNVMVLPSQDRVVFMAARNTEMKVDADQDGELSATERANAYQRLHRRFDKDQDGTLSGLEVNQIRETTNKKFQAEMIKPESSQMVKK